MAAAFDSLWAAFGPTLAPFWPPWGPLWLQGATFDGEKGRVMDPRGSDSRRSDKKKRPNRRKEKTFHFTAEWRRYHARSPQPAQR